MFVDGDEMYCVVVCCLVVSVFFFKQKTAYEMRISDWSSDVCSSDLQNMVPCGDIPPVGVEQSREEHSLLNRDRIEQCPAPHIVFEAACLLFEERRQVTRPYRVCVPNDKDRRPTGLTRHRIFIHTVDRKSVVEGNGGSDSLEFGGG